MRKFLNRGSAWHRSYGKTICPFQLFDGRYCNISCSSAFEQNFEYIIVSWIVYYTHCDFLKTENHEFYLVFQIEKLSLDPSANMLVDLLAC